MSCIWLEIDWQIHQTCVNKDAFGEVCSDWNGYVKVLRSLTNRIQQRTWEAKGICPGHGSRGSQPSSAWFETYKKKQTEQCSKYTNKHEMGLFTNGWELYRIETSDKAARPSQQGQFHTWVPCGKVQDLAQRSHAWFNGQLSLFGNA